MKRVRDAPRPFPGGSLVKIPPAPPGWQNPHKEPAHDNLMLIPSVPTLRMNPGMARLTQRHKVSLVMRPALCQWQPMVYFLNRTQHALLVTLFTERVLGSVTVTDSLPRSAVPTAYSRVTVVLLVAAVFLLLMLLTKAPFCQLRASGKGTRPLRFPWHLTHLLMAKRKPPQDSNVPAKALLTFFHAISIPRPKANVMPAKWTLLFPVQHDGQF